MKKRNMILLTTVCLALSACHPASAPSSGSKTSVSEASGSKQEESKDLAADESLSRELYAMDTVMNLTAYGSNASAALEASVSEINRLDSLLSISSEKGEIYRINADKEGTVSEDVNALLSRSLELSQMTDGLFDCTIEPVMEAWGFTTQNFRIPSEEELEELLSHVDYKQVDLENSAVTIPEDVRLDLGGIAKGFTSSRVMDIFRKNGVTSGIISLGGNVQALGHKPDGNMWRVGIQDPHDLNSTFAVVEVADQAVITSGGYQRYFEENGITHSFMTTQVGRQFALEMDCKSLRYLSVGGEKLVPCEPPKDYKFINAYGPTEATIFTTVFEVDKYYPNVPIGKALDNVKLYITDKLGHMLPPGACGELMITGWQVSRGYLNKPEKTAEVYTKNLYDDTPGYEVMYHSGDVARFLPDGNIQIIGRKDSQVKIRGFRIELSEVEEVIRRYEGIRDATVVAFDDPNGGK